MTVRVIIKKVRWDFVCGKIREGNEWSSTTIVRGISYFRRCTIKYSCHSVARNSQSVPIPFKTWFILGVKAQFIYHNVYTIKQWRSLSGVTICCFWKNHLYRIKTKLRHQNVFPSLLSFQHDQPQWLFLTSGQKKGYHEQQVIQCTRQ